MTKGAYGPLVGVYLTLLPRPCPIERHACQFLFKDIYSYFIFTFNYILHKMIPLIHIVVVCGKYMHFSFFFFIGKELNIDVTYITDVLTL